MSHHSPAVRSTPFTAAVLLRFSVLTVEEESVLEMTHRVVISNAICTGCPVHARIGSGVIKLVAIKL